MMHRFLLRGFRSLGLVGLLVLGGCRKPGVPADALFEALFPRQTDIRFENRLRETQEFNVFIYRNFYNGGGVGLVDFNGDGHLDVFLTANQSANRLYLNRGDWRFEDVTDAAGVAGTKPWTTGVAVADVDGNGWPDLYVCHAGPFADSLRANELYLNLGPDANGIPRFREAAAELGLADTGFSVHAVFFDYDRDGDLDVYVLNNSMRPIISLDFRNTRQERNHEGGDRLYRNDGGRFVDVSAEAGIYGPEIAFGLGVTVADLNRDGWPDLYISNDFFERDYLYLNQGDGTFREVLEEAMASISLSSMGADAADIDNDGFPELFVTDMLPEDDARLKTTTTFEGWQLYQTKVENGFYHQFTRNTLQYNNGDGTFSEIGMWAGVAATDWSWAALIFDADLDGYKDIFVANGIFWDVIDQDYLEYLSAEETMRAVIREEGVDYLALIRKMPSHPLPNYAFQHNGDRTFTNRAQEWGLGRPGFSSGAAYGDLDGDGDLDLIVNDVNGPVRVYRNRARERSGGHFLQVQLIGTPPNTQGIGAQVTVLAGTQRYYQEQMPNRGFQSSVDPVLTFGLGPHDTVDAVVVVWSDGRHEVRRRVAADQRLVFRQEEAVVGQSGMPLLPARATPRFADVTAQVALDYRHQEDNFVDFLREGLMPWMRSREGPRVAVGDVNGDGRDDFYIGGAKGFPGVLFVQQPDGRFARTNEALFAADALSEDLGAAFFDADGDGDLDLYVVSGGNAYAPRAPALQDRLYLNDGRGRFRKAVDHLPRIRSSGGPVAAADYDGDGDIDLFVGGRIEPWFYGMAPESLLLQNDGRGHFTNGIETLAPGLSRIGMVTDAAWADFDGDGRLDLLVVGEWMPLTIFRNAGGGRLERWELPDLAETSGIWHRVAVADFDGDGDPDFIATNLGLNTPLKASPDSPLRLFVKDFDRNGFADHLLARPESTEAGLRHRPLNLRREVLGQLPFLSGRIPSHAAYARMMLEDILKPEELEGAVALEVRELRSLYVENLGEGRFRLHPLPPEAQWAPLYGLLVDDFDGDGHLDVLAGGNFRWAQTSLGLMEATYGLWLRGDGTGRFTAVMPRDSGFFVRGEVRDLQKLARPGRSPLILVARNDDTPRFFVVRR